MRKRKAIPAAIRRDLMLEAGWKCAVLRCEHETGLDVHHIDGDPSNGEYQNLIVLCAVHHRRATQGEIDATACRALKSLLNADRRESGFVELVSKHDVNAALCREIARTHSLRVMLSGPHFLHPDWVFARRAKQLQHEDFDLKLKHFVGQDQHSGAHEVRLMLTNSPRYVDKIGGMVQPMELAQFQADLLSAVASIWPPDCSGPDLCCIHPGFGHIAYIFDEAVITQFRASQTGPTAGGLMWKSQAHIQRERNWFDTIFDSASAGQESEVAKLKGFIASLRFDKEG